LPSKKRIVKKKKKNISFSEMIAKNKMKIDQKRKRNTNANGKCDGEVKKLGKKN